MFEDGAAVPPFASSTYIMKGSSRFLGVNILQKRRLMKGNPGAAASARDRHWGSSVLGRISHPRYRSVNKGTIMCLCLYIHLSHPAALCPRGSEAVDDPKALLPKHKEEKGISRCKESMKSRGDGSGALERFGLKVSIWYVAGSRTYAASQNGLPAHTICTSLFASMLS